jgi:hypothetical protein
VAVSTVEVDVASESPTVSLISSTADSPSPHEPEPVRQALPPPSAVRTLVQPKLSFAMKSAIPRKAEGEDRTDESVREEVLRARSVVPGATAGEQGIAMPKTMSTGQMRDQCANLVGRRVVYEARLEHSGDPFKAYAGSLLANTMDSGASAARAGGHYCIMLLSATNTLLGVEHFPDGMQLEVFPNPLYDYRSIVDASVHQAALAKNSKSEVDHLRAQLQEMKMRLAEAQAGPSSAMRLASAAPAVPPGAPMARNRKLTFAADSYDVTGWADAMEQSPEQLINSLHTKYVSGHNHQPGWERLKRQFDILTSWIMSTSEVDQWIDTEQATLGNQLLWEVRQQSAFCENRVTPDDIMARYFKVDKDADPIDASLFAARARTGKKPGAKVDRVPRPKIESKCFTCGEGGHRKKDCPKNAGNGKAGAVKE